MYSPARFDELPGFYTDDHVAALSAFKTACNGKAPTPLQEAPFPVEDWRRACAAAQNVKQENAKAALAFFTRHFVPYRIASPGHFTGYYVPVLKGSLKKQGAFVHPVYAMPPEYSTAGSAGNVSDRKAIDAGALSGKGLEILWCDDPVMLFFAHVQGSASVMLTDGRFARLSFAGKNGLPYHAIGKTLVEKGELKKEDVSLQTIRDWLYAHSAQAADIMHTNPSYIFFTLEKVDAPVRGSQGTPLTAERSLAVDPAYTPFGLPLFLDTMVRGAAYQRLVMAQDTGSAIKGPGRGDVFFGYGDAAEHLAGDMNASGTLYLLIPKGSADGGR